jgi:hypothetical protein
MSQTALPSPLPSAGRASPRWSTSGQIEPLPASTAGLVPAMECVGDGPPLSASGPSCGSTPSWSDGPSSAQVPSVSMFRFPESKSLPAQLPPPALAARMVFATRTAQEL